jgi:hypothetical protein
MAVGNSPWPPPRGGAPFMGLMLGNTTAAWCNEPMY